jgi:hypothetical protein
MVVSRTVAWPALVSAAVAVSIVAGEAGRGWGAATGERRRALGGDELVADPTWDATRAITIRAPVSQVWPWLAQMGYHRAGWYTFALIDNQGRRPPNRIVPELQGLAPGDLVPDAAGNYAFWIASRVEPPKLLVYTTSRSLLSYRSFGPGDRTPRCRWTASWAFVLDEIDPLTTRLLVRWRMRAHPLALAQPLLWALFGAVDLIMERKMLRTIRRLAERHSGMRRHLGDDIHAKDQPAAH